MALPRRLGAEHGAGRGAAVGRFGGLARGGWGVSRPSGVLSDLWVGSSDVSLFLFVCFGRGPGGGGEVFVASSFFELFYGFPPGGGGGKNNEGDLPLGVPGCGELARNLDIELLPV